MTDADADLDDDRDDELDDGNRVVGAVSRNVLDYLAQAIVEDPAAVMIEIEEGRRSNAVTLRLHSGCFMIWQDALEKIAGTRQMDATAIRDYFAPLQRWLDEQNRGQPVGW